MNKFILVWISVFAFACSNSSETSSGPEVSDKQQVLGFLNLKFGMFIHYGMATIHEGEQWAYAFHDPKDLKPSELDCNKWAEAAESAGMQYGVLTTKHMDGFCLWDSKTTNYDIASAEKEYNKRDIVKEYADAFRKKGLAIGFYWSVWDTHQGVVHGNISDYSIAFMKEQLTELLTNYGEITCLVIDSWGSIWGGVDFEELPYNVLADHIHSLQPNCLIINHSCRADLAYSQVVHYEATHGQHIPYDNTFPSQQGPVIQPTWFWEKGYEDLELKSVEAIVNELEYTNKYYSNYLLNAAPNDRGSLDDNVIQRLKEVGEVVKLSPPLESLPEVAIPHKNVKVKFSSALDEKSAADRNIIDCNLFTAWKAAEEDESPWLELDFEKEEVFNYFSMHAGYKKSIQKYVLEALVGGEWIHLYTGGEATFYEKDAFEEVKARKYRIRILEKNGIPEIKELTFVKY